MLVTVMTPTHKRPEGLAQAMACVRAQTHREWEHLIIADGDDHAVASLVRGVDDPRVRYLHTPERTADWGHSQRNWALARCLGDIVVQLDDDNLMYPHYLETMVEVFERDPDLAYVVCWIDRQGNTPLRPTLPPRYMTIDHLNFAIRREAIERAAGWGTCYEADFKLIETVAAFCKGKVIEETLALYRTLGARRRHQRQPQQREAG